MSPSGKQWSFQYYGSKPLITPGSGPGSVNVYVGAGLVCTNRDCNKKVWDALDPALVVSYPPWLLAGVELDPDLLQQGLLCHK